MKHWIACFILLSSGSLAAQQPAPPKGSGQAVVPVTVVPAPQAIADPAEQGGQPTNIRLDVSVIEQSAQGTAQPKSLMVMLADRAVGRTRAAFQDRSIAVDARPVLIDGRIRVGVTIQSEVSRSPFVPPPSEPQDHTINWRNTFALLLENGKPTLALETMDAVTKRKMSIEVKATIQK